MKVIAFFSQIFSILLSLFLTKTFNLFCLSSLLTREFSQFSATKLSEYKIIETIVIGFKQFSPESSFLTSAKVSAPRTIAASSREGIDFAS